jgi:hypothetical protein
LSRGDNSQGPQCAAGCTRALRLQRRHGARRARACLMSAASRSLPLPSTNSTGGSPATHVRRTPTGAQLVSGCVHLRFRLRRWAGTRHNAHASVAAAGQRTAAAQRVGQGAPLRGRARQELRRRRDGGLLRFGVPWKAAGLPHGEHTPHRRPGVLLAA